MTASTFCGCMSIASGVVTIAVVHLTVNIGFIALSSSKDSYNFGGVVVAPEIQCLNAAVCFLGIPIIMNAIIGMLYYIESNIRLYNLYMIVCLISALAHVIAFASSGSVCNADKRDPRFQHNFACTFTDIFVFFFGSVWCLAMLYFIYIVKSAGEHIRLHVPSGKAQHVERMKQVGGLKSSYGSMPA